MLHFFSKIRYQFASENRGAKYLRYAIGEILLMVIGILIAFFREVLIKIMNRPMLLISLHNSNGFSDSHKGSATLPCHCSVFYKLLMLMIFTVSLISQLLN
jgi:hypothetical protein